MATKYRKFERARRLPYRPDAPNSGLPPVGLPSELVVLAGDAEHRTPCGHELLMLWDAERDAWFRIGCVESGSGTPVAHELTWLDREQLPPADDEHQPAPDRESDDLERLTARVQRPGRFNPADRSALEALLAELAWRRAAAATEYV